MKKHEEKLRRDIRIQKEKLDRINYKREEKKRFVEMNLTHSQEQSEEQYK